MKAYSSTEGKVAPTLVRFALPFMLSSLLQSLYGAADLFVVGQYAGAAAVAAMTAQNIGAGKPQRALQSLKWSILFSLAFGLLVCLFANLWPEVLPAIFTTDGEVIRAAGLYLRTYSMDCALVAFVFSFNNYFSGCGNAMISMIHNIIATFAVRIPVTLAMSKLAGATMLHMGLAAPASSLLSIIICAGYFLWLRKKNKIPA